MHKRGGRVVHKLEGLAAVDVRDIACVGAKYSMLDMAIQAMNTSLEKGIIT